MCVCAHACVHAAFPCMFVCVPRYIFYCSCYIATCSVDVHVIDSICPNGVWLWLKEKLSVQFCLFLQAVYLPVLLCVFLEICNARSAL